MLTEDAATDPLTVLHRLREDGTLADALPRLPALLASLDDADLARAGQLLRTLDLEAAAEVHPALPRVSVAVTGGFTLEPFAAPLLARLLREGFVPAIRVSAYDQYRFDLTDPGSDLYAAGPDIVLCVLAAQTIFEELPLPWTADDLGKALTARLEELERLVAVHERSGSGTLVLNTLPLPSRFARELVDRRSRTRLGIAWRAFNTGLLRLGLDHPSVVVLDLDLLVADGLPATDPRMSVYARMHFSEELVAAYCREAAHLVRGLRGRARKCLVLDLDGTLWGGTLGEDGVEGIEVADGRRGAAFADFQRVVKQLGAQGVLLAVSSKNDDEPVRRALRDHPRMAVRESDFAVVNANWAPKPDNLRDIAHRLNLGTDGLVFADDEPAEIGMVSAFLPEVAVVPLDREPALHSARLLEEDWFAVPEVTEEDGERLRRYRTERRREDFEGGFGSVQDYLRALRIRVELFRPADPDLPRISQLTLRTNQFNLTTRRMDVAEVARFAADPDTLLVAIRAADRFGDQGIVGCVFARRAGERLSIENMLLSCRVLSRGIETACAGALLEYSRAHGVREVYGLRRPSAKNHRTRDLFTELGFTPVPGDPGGVATFRHDLSGALPEAPHITVTTNFGTG